MTLRIKALTEEEYEKLTSDKYKACNECRFRMKDVGVLTTSAHEIEDRVFGCGLGQFQLCKEVSNLPEKCPARNLNVMEVREVVVENEGEKKERNNCTICSAYNGKNPICKDKKIKFISCRCKTCDRFSLTDDGCMNFEKGCQEGFRYEFLDTQTQVAVS